MKNKLLHNWTIQRIFYTVAGIVISIAAISAKEWPAILLGVYFTSMGLFAFGCASSNGCYGGNCIAPMDKTTRTRQSSE